MELVILAKVTFPGRSDPAITVLASGTQDGHLERVITEANRKLSHPFKIPPNVIYETTVKDQEYSVYENPVGMPNSSSRFCCKIEIEYALQEDGKFFSLSQIYPKITAKF